MQRGNVTSTEWNPLLAPWDTAVAPQALALRSLTEMRSASDIKRGSRLAAAAVAAERAAAPNTADPHRVGTGKRR